MKKTKLLFISLILFVLMFGAVNAASFPYLLAQGTVEKVYSMRLLEPEFSHTQYQSGGCYEYAVGYGESFTTLCSLSGIWFANVSAYYGSFRGLEYHSIGESYTLFGYPPKTLLPLAFNVEGDAGNVSHQTADAYINSTLIGSGELGYIIDGSTGEIWVYFFTGPAGLDFSGYTGGQYVNLSYDTSKFRIMFAPPSLKGDDDPNPNSNFLNMTDVGFAAKTKWSPNYGYEYLLGDGFWSGTSSVGNSVRGTGVYEVLSFGSFINKWYVYKNTPTEIFNHVYLERIIDGYPYVSNIKVTAGDTIFYNNEGRNNIDIEIPDYKLPIYGIFDNLFGYVVEVLMYSGGPVIPPPTGETWNVIVNVYDESTYSKYNGATVTKYDLTNPFFNEIKTDVQGTTTLSVNLEHHYNITATDIGMSTNYVDYFAFDPIQNVINIWIRPIREEIPDKGYLEFRVMKLVSLPNDMNIPDAKITLTDTQVNFTNSMGYTYFMVNAPASYGYRVDKSGYESVTGNVSISDGEQKYIGIIMTAIPAITPTPAPTISGETPSNPIEAIYFFFKTFGVTKTDNVNLIIAMGICLTCALILAYYTHDGLATVAGGALGFIISLGLGLIPIWILIAAAIILGLVIIVKYRGA